MNHYVVCLGIRDGLVFAHVKASGPWGARGWNGPGGSIRLAEPAALAAHREWNEEVRGCDVVGPWELVGKTSGDEWSVSYMCAPVGFAGFPLTVDGLPATFISPEHKPAGFKSAQDFLEMSARAIAKLA